MLRKILDVGGYSLMVLGNLLAFCLSRRTAYFLAEYVMVCFYFIYRKSRRLVIRNMEYLISLSGVKYTEQEFKKKARRYAKQLFINFGKQIYDMMVMTRYSEDALSEVFDFDKVEKIGEMLAQGKGAIGITAHFSSWELCAMMLAMRYGALNAVFMRHSNPGVNNFYIRQRAARNVKAIMPGPDCLKGCVNALHRGELLAIVGDLDYTNSGMHVPFLGKLFRAPKGAPLIALRSGAPMFYAAFVRKGSLRIGLEYGGTITVPENLDTEEKIKYISNIYLRYFEKIIIKDPTQWIMFFPLADLPDANPRNANLKKMESEN
jgi:Kdo2-lipid IVA lauroyltransferase/acyltransferase